MCTVLRDELCVGVDADATKELNQRKIERQSALKETNLRYVSMKI